MRIISFCCLSFSPELMFIMSMYSGEPRISSISYMSPLYLRRKCSTTNEPCLPRIFSRSTGSPFLSMLVGVCPASPAASSSSPSWIIPHLSAELRGTMCCTYAAPTSFSGTWKKIPTPDKSGDCVWS